MGDECNMVRGDGGGDGEVIYLCDELHRLYFTDWYRIEHQINGMRNYVLLPNIISTSIAHT